MSITVGTDTYITVAEADTIIAENYVSTDEQRIVWTPLDDADKEIHLKRATRKMQGLKYQGFKEDIDTTQKLAFPRCFRTMVGDSSVYFYRDILSNNRIYRGYCCQSEVPDDVKEAEAFEALELSSPSGDTASSKIAGGNIKSFSTTDFSQTNQVGDKYGIDAIMFSNRAKEILRVYIGGGYRIV